MSPSNVVRRLGRLLGGRAPHHWWPSRGREQGSAATSEVPAVTGGAGPALDSAVPATGEDTVEVEQAGVQPIVETNTARLSP
jgi:hypothetical protein